MHLNDAIGRSCDTRFVCCHHEQACAMAADSYYRLTNRAAAVNVTAGPGCTNLITGVFGAWTDSLGMIVISGQVKTQTLARYTGLPLRQLGDQEIDIVPMIKSITKYAVLVEDPQTIRYHLERSIHLASHGRPGPCWLDIPINIQGIRIDPTKLSGYDPDEDKIDFETGDLKQTCATILEKLQMAKRPLIYAGSGLRLSGAYEDFLRLIDRLHVPVVTAWNSNDLLWDEHPLYVGRPGTLGDRAGNFAVQNSDCLLVLGCRLNIRQVSYNWENFARGAYKIVVDIDAAELKKPTVSVDLPVHADVKDVVRTMLEAPALPDQQAHRDWGAWCVERRRRYPVVLPEYSDAPEPVNPYCFMQELFRQLREGDTIVAGDGTACVAAFQAAEIKPGQRLYHSSGCAPMGYDLPAAVGAAVARPGERVICIAGDGSIQMNIQELQTIAGSKLPVKIFVLNNGGYLSVMQTQRNFFPDNIVGCDAASGVSFPDFGKIAHAYGIPFHRCTSHADLAATVRETLAGDGPQLMEVVLDQAQQFAPKLTSRVLEDGTMVASPLEDMAPFLSREELRENMIQL